MIFYPGGNSHIGHLYMCIGLPQKRGLQVKTDR